MQRDAIKAIVRETLLSRLAARDPDPPPANSADRPRLVCERDVLEIRGKARALRIAPGTIVTPLARETAARYGIDLVTLAPASASGAPPVPAPRPEAPAAPASPIGEIVALGADHGGFALKESLKRFLEDEGGFVVVDYGTDSSAAVDYPDFAHKVAGAVSRGEAWRGIVIDGVGVGSCMAANRHAGVRAAAAAGIIETINAREHNDANVLCLGGRMVGDLLARALAVTFLTTAFAGGRHARRVAKIEQT